ncbi:MAG: SUMF1/EgtB/PvdO family nonheme iron enzyme [Neomegalonema sp.]|nr:SUMF1/EgtB/PvdO family nonheme iron enzyme [Neomegalonema sp.]
MELFAAPPSDAAARIRAAQTALKALGYDIGEVDGVAGAKTEAALTAFQKAAHIDASGAADQATLDALALAVRYRAALKPIAPPISSFKDLESFTECAACPEMVAIPAGSFLMGSPKTELKRDEDEGPQRRVAIKRFAIGKYEITFEQWDRCAAEGYCRSNPKPKDMGWGRGKRPVTNVSWDDITGAGGFLDWLNSKVPGSPYRLPSEAEWEYAARAGTRGPFSFTDKISADKANYDAEISYDGSPTGVYRRKTLAVGSFKPNPWGLYDVHGNVWEWVQDCWHGSYKGAPTDGSAWMAASGGNCSYAVLRGGSWYNNPYWLRSARRFSYPRSVRYGLIGFRVARTIIPS